ncbi:MAG: amino acid-binding protein, partial [Rhodospirillales bacterium]|nr:amino acid-binding protein [Rhodospirillales bacterium]
MTRAPPGEKTVTQTLVLTFIATDRPGLVERLAQAVADQGGNWLESRMVRLAEKFVGVARVEAPNGRIAQLRAALLALEAEGFHLTVEEAAGGVAPPDRLLVLDLVGPDHP